MTRPQKGEVRSRSPDVGGRGMLSDSPDLRRARYEALLGGYILLKAVGRGCASKLDQRERKYLLKKA